MAGAARVAGLSRVGVVANRLTVGFVFAAAYQSVVGLATSLMSLPLTGDIGDLLVGIKEIETGAGHLLIAWWVASTMIITSIAMLILRFKKYISPYRGEPDLDIPSRITAVTAVVTGAIISLLFFLLDAAVGAFYEGGQDVQSAYQAALSGDFEPLAASLLFSVAAGFIIVGVGSRTGRVREITRNVGLADIAAGLRRGRARTTVADTVGMRPGEMVHVGSRKVEEVTFELIRYSAGSYERRRPSSPEDCGGPGPGVSWTNVVGIHDAGVVAGFGRMLGLHKLVQADIMNTDLRPRVEFSDAYVFVVLKMPHLDDDVLSVEQVSLVDRKSVV